MCASISGCADKRPDEETLKQDIVKEIEENGYIDHGIRYIIKTSLFDGSYYLERDPKLTSLEIKKSRTEEDRYSVWCDVTFEDSACRDIYSVSLVYEKYDGNIWERTGFDVDYSKTQSIVLQEPSEECIKKMLAAAGGDLQMNQILDHGMRSDNDCEIFLELTNVHGIFTDIWQGTYNVDIAGYETPVTVNARIVLSYNGMHEWKAGGLASDPPDIEQFTVGTNAAALTLFAKFFLNGSRNLDTLQLTDYAVEENGRYMFRFDGADGYIKLYMNYIGFGIALEFSNADLDNWNFKYSGSDNGPLFFDPYPNNGF